MSGASGDGISGSGVTGTVTIANSTITGSTVNNAIITDTSGTLNLTVTDSTFSDDDAMGDNDEGLDINANGSTNATVSVTGSTFTNNNGLSFDFETDSAATGTNSVTFSNNTVSSTITDNGAGVEITPSGTSHTTVTVDGNNIQGVVSGNGIGIDAGVTANTSDATLTGTVNGNTVGSPTVAGGGGNAIGIFAEGSSTETLAVTNNKLYQYANVAGIEYYDREGGPTLNLTITGNTIADPDNEFGVWGIYGEGGVQSTDSGKVCADISGNSMTGSGTGISDGEPDFELDQAGSTVYELPGYTGGSTDTNAVVNFVADNNNSGGTPSGIATVDGGGFSNTPGGAACPTP